MTPKKIKLTKYEVADRQLHTAVRAVFSEEDPVSTHTLAAASHQVFSDLVKRSSEKDPEVLRNMIAKDKWPKLKNELREPANFFKHADRDPESTLTFRPVITHLLMLESICHIEVLGRIKSWRLRVFGIWFAKNHEALMSPGGDLIRCVELWKRIGCPETLSDFHEASESQLVALSKGASANRDEQA